MEKGSIFFESYNMAIEAAYDKHFRNAEKDILQGIRGNESELQQYLEDEKTKWQDIPLKDLGGSTPAEYIASTDSFDSLLELFCMGAVMCDDSLPDIVLSRLESFGSRAVDALLKIALENRHEDHRENDFLVPLMAIRILGEWKVERAAAPLIELLDDQGENSEIFSERVKDALVFIGKPALESIMRALERKGLVSPAGEYLLMALSDIGSTNQSDSVYRCLKDAFFNIPDKAIGAICLGNYGDGRAIPALRGYIEKNGNNIDKNTFYEVVSAIKRLGGNTDDLESLYQ